jgi:hypothetical protein
MAFERIVKKINKKVSKTWLKSRFQVRSIKKIDNMCYILEITDAKRLEIISSRTKTAHFNSFWDQIFYVAGFQRHKDTLDEIKSQSQKGVN